MFLINIRHRTCAYWPSEQIVAGDISGHKVIFPNYSFSSAWCPGLSTLYSLQKGTFPVVNDRRKYVVQDLFHTSVFSAKKSNSNPLNPASLTFRFSPQYGYVNLCHEGVLLHCSTFMVGKNGISLNLLNKSCNLSFLFLSTLLPSTHFKLPQDKLLFRLYFLSGHKWLGHTPWPMGLCVLGLCVWGMLVERSISCCQTTTDILQNSRVLWMSKCHSIKG